MKAGCITPAAVTALLLRATSGAAFASTATHPLLESRKAFWDGYQKALIDLQSGAGERSAQWDARSGGYKGAGSFGTTAAALPVGFENLSVADAMQALNALGIQAAAEFVMDLQLDRILEIKHAEVAVIEANRKAPGARVEPVDDAGEHAGSVGRRGSPGISRADWDALDALTADGAGTNQPGDEVAA